MNSGKQRHFDERISFNRKDKIPYGLYAAYTLLGKMFNGSTVKVSRVKPQSWADKDYVDDGHTLMFLVSRQFNPSKEELNFLDDFVKDGNNVFICSPYMNQEAREYFKLKEEYYSPVTSFGIDHLYDSGYSSLSYPPFPGKPAFFNPGYSYAVALKSDDSSYYEMLGRDKIGKVNLARLRAGSGSFIFHSNPFLFSNYFLLHQDNVKYFEGLLSLIPGSTKKIIWDEYYVYKSEDTNRDDPWPLRVLAKQSSFLWALLLSLFFLMLYVLLNVKRVQRMIPVLAKPKNESLDFIKTMGRLYYEKGDHANLSKKMAAYFLDVIRNKYYIQTGTLDGEFIKNLSAKSGYPEEGCRKLIDKIQEAQTADEMSEEELVELYSLISEFYKKSG